MDAYALQERARKSEGAAREKLSRLTDGALSVAWLKTETMPMSDELPVVRGWLTDELEKRMSPEKFEAWLFTDGDAVDPAPFLAG
ncbi:hypothetical protein [Streptomyces sp. S1D4-14]|uniref:hypothetical protein n=1 Tax=Streptomyces sp. S1D4-14 TaxID=2594461 RepID=UPI0011659929|nr:hypothetical protein [Streptomyces sp. S1D4-14]QDN64494.1 hypothetical protein FNV66_01275 [Streptomyces sp. S1D4-14]